MRRWQEDSRYLVVILPTNLPVGASLLAMRPVHSTMMLTVRPLSRAGSLPQGYAVDFALVLGDQVFRQLEGPEHAALVEVLDALGHFAAPQRYGAAPTGEDRDVLFTVHFPGHRRAEYAGTCLLYTSPSPRDQRGSRMPSSA